MSRSGVPDRWLVVAHGLISLLCGGRGLLTVGDIQVPRLLRLQGQGRVQPYHRRHRDGSTRRQRLRPHRRSSPGHRLRLLLRPLVRGRISPTAADDSGRVVFPHPFRPARTEVHVRPWPTPAEEPPRGEWHPLRSVTSGRAANSRCCVGPRCHTAIVPIAGGDLITGEGTDAWRPTGMHWTGHAPRARLRA